MHIFLNKYLIYLYDFNPLRESALNIVQFPLLNVDFTYLPVLVRLRDVDGHVTAVVSFTATRSDTSGQSKRLDGRTPNTRSVQSSEVTRRPLPLSHRHLEVGSGAGEMMSGDSDSQRRVKCVRHRSIDNKSSQPTLVLWFREPATGAFIKRVDIGVSQNETRLVVRVSQAS